MKETIESLVNDALQQLASKGELTLPESYKFSVEHTRDKAHGDLACNAAMVLCKAVGMKPRDLAAKIVASLPANDSVTKVDIAGPGFLNFFLAEGQQFDVVGKILNSFETFARPNIGNGENVLIEFVSANPTGPMHVGHGRGAAYGSALANVMRAVGFRISTEYYINDAGRQADVLAVSLFLRYLETLGEAVRIPSRAYPGEYVKRCAENLKAAHGEAFKRSYVELMQGVAPDSDEEGDEAKKIKEKHLDSLIERIKTVLGDDYQTVQDFGLNEQLTDIRATLDGFEVHFDNWFSERSLTRSGAVSTMIEKLKAKDRVYEKDGALWLKTEDMGDEKDRVLIKEDGSYTYLSPDIAYHLDKLNRGFDTLIDVWGADHHGYIARMRAAIEALSGKGEQFHVSLIQFVTLSSGRMGKRSGNFVTLKDLIQEAGADATRFFYLTRSHDQHLEFDIELARSQSNDNPVFYIQYAHARICSVFRQAVEKGYDYDEAQGLASLETLTTDHELALAVRLAKYPEMVAASARNRAPHQLTHFLRDVATDFHSWYNAEAFLVADDRLRNARLVLCAATRKVLADCLGLLGVSAPEQM